MESIVRDFAFDVAANSLIKDYLFNEFLFPL